MAVKKTTKKSEAEIKSRRTKETNIICIILIYIVGIAAVGVGAYAFTEKGFVENRLTKVATKYANMTSTNGKTLPFINAELDEKVCKNVGGKVTCVKNVSDTSVVKGFTILISETYDLDGDQKKNIATTLTINGSVVTVAAGFEVDTIEGKNINGKDYALINIVNGDDSRALLIDSIGRNAVN